MNKNIVCNMYTIFIEFSFENSNQGDSKRKAISRTMGKFNSNKKSPKVYTIDCHASEIEKVIKVVDEVSDAYQLINVIRIINHSAWCRLRYKYKGGVEFIGAESLEDLIS